MASIKKYAGLPNVDEGVEIFESSVPDLTDTNTAPTESIDSEQDSNNDSNFARDRLDPDAARARFGRAVVNARDADFSDTVVGAGGRRDYRVRKGRRRRMGTRRGMSSDGESSEDDQEETLHGRLARLRREAAELQAEIDRVERGEGKKLQEENGDDSGDDDRSAYEDAADGHHPQTEDLSKGVDELNKTLEAVSIGGKARKGRSLEEEFMSNLDREPQGPQSKYTSDRKLESIPQSSISAIAEFSDRLSALETALGVSSQQTSSNSLPSSIIPTLSVLTTQIETLSSTLSPQSNHPSATNTTTTTTTHLDPLAQKIRHLITESKRLEDSRRAATNAFTELIETRDRHAHLLPSSPHSHSAIHSNTDNRLSRTLNNQDNNSGIPTINGGNNASVTKSKEDMQSEFTTLFLDSDSSKISALHSLLPTIQSLQPLLPVVLERLRALSVIHTGAAEVRGELDDFESRLQTQERDIVKWRDALKEVEAAMREGKDVMRENVGVIGEMIRGLEGRVGKMRG